jgi:hypothetical protein
MNSLLIALSRYGRLALGPSSRPAGSRRDDLGKNGRDRVRFVPFACQIVEAATATYECKFRNKQGIDIDASITNANGSVDLFIPSQQVAIVFLDEGDYVVSVFNDADSTLLFSDHIKVKEDDEWLILTGKLSSKKHPSP